MAIRYGSLAWTADQRKMSKSLGNVADPIQAIDEFGTDIVRYYLARVGGRFKDDVGTSQHIIYPKDNTLTRVVERLVSPSVGETRQGDHVVPGESVLACHFEKDTAARRGGRTVDTSNIIKYPRFRQQHPLIAL